MAIDVYQPTKKQKDPLDNLVKMASIGVSAANMSKSGNSVAQSSDQSEAMNRRLDQIKAENKSKMDDSIFSKDKYTMRRY